MVAAIEEEEEHIYCARCEEYTVLSEVVEDQYCSDYCYDRDNEPEEGDSDNLIARNWNASDLPHFQSRNCGETIQSLRKFSVEIEAYYPDVYTANRAANRLPREIGISGDGSLGNDGIEYQTPKLQGRNGEDVIKQLCETLNSNDFRVDRPCGLHVHIDGTGLFPRTRTKTEPFAIKNLLLLYIAYEDVLQSFLPRSRRNNRYAMHVRNNFHASEIKNIYSLEKLEQMWYRVARRVDLKAQKEHKYNSTRYNGLNLHSLFKDGHLEIRYHSGTINASKILHWTALHLAMVDYAQNHGTRSDIEIIDIQEKAQYLLDMLDITDATRDYFLQRQAHFHPHHVREDATN